MASFNGNIGVPDNHFNLKVEYSIEQSILNNESTITAIGYVKRNVTYVWPYNYQSVATMYIDGKVSTQNPSYNLGSDGYKEVIRFTTTVKHDNQGKKKVLISFAFNGLLNEYYPTGSIQQEIELPQIPRVSDIETDKTEYNIGDKITITTIKKADIFTDKVGISFGKTINDEQFIKYLSEDVTEPIIWNTAEDAQELYKMIPNDTSGICKIFVETYNGDELIGTANEVLVKLNVVNSNPKFENFTYADVNEKTLNLTGNNQTIIKGYSNVKGIVSVANKAIAINGATMKKYRFVIGEKQEEFDYSDTEEVNQIIKQVQSNSFVMYAIDSRNNSKIKQISPERYIEYKKPTILEFDVYRTLNGVGEPVNLKISGEFWNDNFGIKDNTLKITYIFKDTDSFEWSLVKEITPTIDGNKYSFEGQISGDLENAGFNLENSYDIQVFVTDELDEAEIQDIVGSGTPNMAMHKNGTAFNSIYDEVVGGLMQIAGEKTAEKTDEDGLKIYASHSLKNGKRLLTEEDISGGDVDLSDYYTKSETDAKIDEKIDAIPDVDLSNFYNKTEIDVKLDAKADSTEIPDISGLETKTDATAKLTEAKSYTDTKISEIPVNDLLHYKGHVDSVEDLPYLGQPSGTALAPVADLSGSIEQFKSNINSKATGSYGSQKVTKTLEVINSKSYETYGKYFFACPSTNTYSGFAIFVTDYPEQIKIEPTTSYPHYYLQALYDANKPVYQYRWVFNEDWTIQPITALTNGESLNRSDSYKLTNIPKIGFNTTGSVLINNYYYNADMAFIALSSDGVLNVVTAEMPAGSSINDLMTVGNDFDLYRINNSKTWELWSASKGADLPSGGKKGQVLGKLSNADNDIGWIDQTGGGGSGGGTTIEINRWEGVL